MPLLRSWDEVVAFALTLPGTELSTSWGKPAVKVAAHGRAFLYIGREAGSFVLAIDQDSKLILLETDPDTYWQTPHYEGWDGVLIRFTTDDSERVAAMIERARDQAAAKNPPRSRKGK